MTQKTQYYDHVCDAPNILLGLKIWSVGNHKEQQTSNGDHGRPDNVAAEHNQQAGADHDWRIEEVEHHSEWLLAEGVAEVVKGIRVKEEGQEGANIHHSA